MDIIRKPNGFIIKKAKKSRKKIKIPKFTYIVKKTQKKVKESKVLERINSLRIPPGYKKVSISSKPNSKIQAIAAHPAVIPIIKAVVASFLLGYLSGNCLLVDSCNFFFLRYL